MKIKTLYDSPRYKSFIEDRNQALEKIESHAQLDISRMLFDSLENITGYVSHMAITKEMTLPQLKYLTYNLEQFIGHQFDKLTPLLEGRISRLRKRVFVLSYIGELEAIARATKKTPALNISDFKMKIQAQQRKDTMLDQSWNLRLYLNFHQLKVKIIHAFQRAVALESTPLELVHTIKKAYPPIQVYQKPPRAIKPLREAHQPDDSDDTDDKQNDEKEFDFYHSLTNDDDWSATVNAYKDTELPPSRFDNQANFNPDRGTMQYNWEVEQEVTDDFVDQVRDGQIQAATDMGVKDFVWVAIVDKKTCEDCCLPRAGKLVSEIKSMLSSGELDKDDCDATTPPAHPNCRCDLAPVASTDEVEGPDWKSFGDWLDS